MLKKISVCFLLFISTLSVSRRLAIALTFLFGKNVAMKFDILRVLILLVWFL